MRLELHPFPSDLGTITKLLGGDELQTALTSHRTIGMAIGILMQGAGMTDEAALARLVQASHAANVSLTTVAQQVVDVANQATERTVPTPADAIRQQEDAEPTVGPMPGVRREKLACQ